MLPYNEKVWARPTTDLAHAWVSDRVAQPSLHELLKTIRLHQDNTSWGPNASFRYPRRGGVGRIWQRLACRLSRRNVHYGQQVRSIDRVRRTARCASGKEFGYDYLVSTMPLDQLAEVAHPAEDVAAAKLLKKNVTHIIGFGFRGAVPESLAGRLWGYYPQASLPFYRLTLMSNLSEENTPAPGATWSVMAEVAESEHVHFDGDIVRLVEDGLCQTAVVADQCSIISRWHRTLPHGYPVPTRDRDTILTQLHASLAADNIFSRGRFGAWKYEVSNQDHSFMQGVEVIDHIVSGRPEVTLPKPDLVNSRYNLFPFPEWQV